MKVDEFTTEAMLGALRTLEENNVPPTCCPSCAATFYLLLPEGGPPWVVECGESWLVGHEFDAGVIGRV